MTPPPNAPEAGSNGEREALAAKLTEAERKLADQVKALGIEKAAVRHYLSCALGYDGSHPELAEDVSVLARQVKAMAEMALAEKRWPTSAQASAYERMRDERDALAEALREIVDFNWAGAWRDNKSMNDVVDEMVASARAALAGNGNGTGEGDGEAVAALVNMRVDRDAWRCKHDLALQSIDHVVDQRREAERERDFWRRDVENLRRHLSETVAEWREMGEETITAENAAGVIETDMRRALALIRPLPAAPPSAGETT